MSPPTTTQRPLRLVDLELDLEVFAGPFDLLLTLILREEVDILEVDLADVVISYIDHLEARGELDLEAATEFLVLITTLLELKSRLMLPGEEVEEIELDAGEAAAELLQRLLDAHRYRSAAQHLAALLRDQAGFRFRSAPLPQSLRKAALPEAPAPCTTPSSWRGDREMLVFRRRSTSATSRHRRSRSRSGSPTYGDCCGAERSTFDEAVAGADRMTVAVTLFSLLELYKQGELTWSQDQPFGEIEVRPRPARVNTLQRTA